MSDPDESRSIHVWSAADGKLHRVTDELFNEESPAWDPDGEYLFYLSDREFAPQISTFEWNFADEPHDRHLRAHPEEGRQEPVPAADRRGDLRGEEGGGRGEARGRRSPTADDGKDDDRRPRRRTRPPRRRRPSGSTSTASAPASTRVPVEADNYRRARRRQGPPALHRDRRALLRPRLVREARAQALLASRTARSRPSPRTSTAGRCPRDGSEGPRAAGGQASTSTTSSPTPRTRRRSRRRASWSTACPPRSGGRSSTRSGGATATSSTSRTCTATTGRRSATATAPSCPTSPTAPTSTTCSARWSPSSTSATPTSRAATTRSRRARRSALPGARFELDPASGRYRIARILPGQNEEDLYRSPLTEVGVDARVGDYVLAIDGVELRRRRRPLPPAAPQDRPGHPDPQREAGPRGRPQDDLPARSPARSRLLYLEWTNANREKVAKLTNGRAGYLHIPDMGAPGIYEFIKWFYPQIRKEGLVVDVRSNGGGNVSQWIIERLRHEAARHALRPAQRARRARTRRRSSTATWSRSSTRPRPRTATSSRTCSARPASARSSASAPGAASSASAASGPLIDGGSVSVPLERHERRRRQVDHRGPRRRPRHRGRERPEVGDRRARPAARAGGRRSS